MRIQREREKPMKSREPARIQKSIGQAGDRFGQTWCMSGFVDRTENRINGFLYLS